MRKRSQLFIMGLLVLSVLTLRPVFAQEATPGDYFYGIGTKLGRGLWQIVSSPADIPCEMTFAAQEEGASGLASGFGKGTLFMLRRILVGATEVVTFVIPMERTIPPACTNTNPISTAGVQG